jgi:hypothetical protein
VLTKERNVTFGHRMMSGNRQPYPMDCFPKLDDLVQRLGVAEQSEVGLRPDQANLSRPSQKKFPIAQKFCRLLG